MRIQSNLKALLDERDMSIRELERRTGERFNSLRMLYHDEMERYPRALLANTCEALGVDISDLLTFTDEGTTKEGGESHA